MSRSLLIGAAALAVPVVPALASFEYAYDDGSGSSNIGPSSFSAQMLWGNYFEVQGGYNRINQISISFTTSLAPDLPVTLMVFDDPDDDLDPRNATLLATANRLTEDTLPSTFATYSFPETVVSGGFFIAALMDLPQGQAAARMDGNNNVGRSWTFFDGAIDPGNLGGSPLIFSPNGTSFSGTSANPFPGVYMIRANAIPTPGAMALGLVAASMVVRRKR